jgi:hypothetical protein
MIRNTMYLTFALLLALAFTGCPDHHRRYQCRTLDRYDVGSIRNPGETGYPYWG